MDAIRYANSLFSLMKKEDIIEEFIGDFGKFIDILETNSTWKEMMNSPIVSDVQKEKNISELIVFNKYLTGFLRIIIQRKDFNKVVFVYDELMAIYYKTKNIAIVRVYTAKKLNKTETENIVKKAKSHFGDEMEVKLQIMIDKNLLGGVRIIYQGEELDYTYRRKLRELKSFI